MILLAALVFPACSEEPPAESPGASGTAGSSGAGGNDATGGASGSSGGLAGSTGAGAPAGGAGSGGSASGGTPPTAGGGAGGTVSGAAGVTAAGAGGTFGGGAGGQAGDGGGSGSAGAGAGGSSGGAGGTPNGGTAGAMAGAGAGGAGAGGAAGSAGTGGSSYQPCPAEGPCVIMPFGDSITEGFPVNGGYRAPLFALALENGKEITFVGSASNNSPSMVNGVSFPRNHEGHGGYTIENNPGRNTNGIAPLVSPSMRNYKPDIVLLMIGTNDINGNIDVGSAPQRLGALLDAIYAEDPDVLIVLAQIVPTRNDGTNQTVQTYNAAMPALVMARQNAGRHIVLLDMYGAFTRDANYKNALLGDNLHPNQSGYDRMAETWYEAIAEYLR